MAGLLSKIKEAAKKTGGSRGKLFFVTNNEKRRLRFLKEIDDGLEVVFHDSFEEGINVPCQEVFGRSCDMCGREQLRTRSLYAWPVWDYDSNEVKVFLYAVNNCSPIPQILALNETYGTITDRDYVVQVNGKQKDKTFSVIPLDKAKFRNEKAKPLSDESMLKLIDKAYPLDTSVDIDIEDDDEQDEAENKYNGKKAIELYKLCKQREIEAEMKRPVNYYINLLVAYDKAQDEWGEDDKQNEDDEWGEADDNLPL